MSRPLLRAYSPHDGSLLLERPAADLAQIESVCSRLRQGHQRWARQSLEMRLEKLERFVAAIVDRSDELSQELSETVGRPISFTPGEFRGFAERAQKMMELAPGALSDILIDNSRFIERRPLGTVFVIAAWNYPYLIAVNAVLPALAAGNSVLLKHSEQTMVVAERFAEAARAAELPDGAFEFLHLTHQQTEELVGSGRFDLINFTGSVEGGRTLHRAAGGSLTPMGLELGGKDAAYVRADADLEATAVALADGAFFNSGQSCCGVERIYVHAGRYDEFLDLLCLEARKLKLGPPLDPSSTLGPMIRPSAAERVQQQIERTVAAGAEALLKRPGSEGAYLPPEVLIDVHHGMEIMTEETFGPVVGVMPVDSDEEAVLLINDSRYGLTASIWTSDLHRAVALGHQLEVGTVLCNRCDYLDPSLAWTAMKDSGRGCTLSRVGFEQLTRPKSYYLRKAPN